MGKWASYNFMVQKLKQLWQRKGEIEIFDLENDFYFVSFQSNEDYMEALIGGPWVVSDAYLNVARWRLEFNLKKETIETMVAWVRFPDLLAPLFDKIFLLNLGNAIGKAIRLDVHTAQRSRGKFARMCIELDLTKPLVPEFEVEGQILSVVYESMEMLCKKCGIFGHRADHYGEFHKRQEEVLQRNDKGGEGNIERSDDGREKEELWKTVQRNRRQRKVANPEQNIQRGSRFAVLE
ncbi:uncharacterized protein LOC114723032 [Neltuma alba]|uniref:uncharacterized protein LOC114723032 n=1 Tax=Neltuma alba TaxID=207710 RepID=UPI0010A46544|nr:uncharacterized protein LOC114723032 [Prosopis alba]